jgi:ParB family chromosome partitioning protein
MLLDRLAAEAGFGVVLQIETEQIHPHPANPRKSFDDANIPELETSMRRFGQRAPVQVIRHPKLPGQFMLVDGERRWRAARYNKEEPIKSLRAVIEAFNEREARYAMIVSMLTASN